MKIYGSLRFLVLLGCLAAIIPSEAYPPAPYYRIYGVVRDEYGTPLSADEGVVILSGIYSALGSAGVTGARGSVSGTVTMVHGGSGFTSVPEVTFTGANGTGEGAQGVAEITDGVVTGITVTRGGRGYVAPVTVGISGGGAPLIEMVRRQTGIFPNSPGTNYALPVPMDAAKSPALYDVDSMRHLLPFTIRVVIDDVNYAPLQIAGAPEVFWKEKIDSQNEAPGILTNADNWAVGLPGETLRLDLWLGIDSDGDGIPDAWERDLIDASGGLYSSIEDVNPDDDLNGNGMTNLDNFIAGVYGLDSNPMKFRIHSVIDSTAELSFQVIRNRTYSLAGSSDMKVWTDPLPFSLSGDGSDPVTSFLAAESQTTTVFVPVGTSPEIRFFKLYVQ